MSQYSSNGGSRPQPRSTIPAKRSATDAGEEAWVADEDKFVLKQAKKKALIRVRGGRASPIDLLAVTLRALDGRREGYNSDDDDDDDEELPMVDAEGVFEGLDDEQLGDLERGIDTYLTLEKSRSNREYWNTMKIICRERREYMRNGGQSARGMSSVSRDLDKLLGPKTHDQLDSLEKQVRQKLRSDEPIDMDYWENLLKSIAIYKAKARMRSLSHTLLSRRLDALRSRQRQEAVQAQATLRAAIATDPSIPSSLLPVTAASDSTSQPSLPVTAASASSSSPVTTTSDPPSHPITATSVPSALDPEPLLRLNPEDKSLPSFEALDLAEKLLQQRRRVLKLGYIPAPPAILSKHSSSTAVVPQSQLSALGSDASRTTSALYEREAARGFNDNEEAFAVEQDLGLVRPPWADKYKPRKPLYFNRVQMGYEWNKYNQTHYDHDNPPPKVVQGYRFNIFYPDLVDPVKAPTFRIERENGRKRGQSFAPPGEEDTCLIRFVAGPPYQDIAFRIVDKEWDYSAKRDRNFRSSFDKGILQLHFQFKKVYYRK